MFNSNNSSVIDKLLLMKAINGSGSGGGETVNANWDAQEGDLGFIENKPFGEVALFSQNITAEDYINGAVQLQNYNELLATLQASSDPTELTFALKIDSTSYDLICNEANKDAVSYSYYFVSGDPDDADAFIYLGAGPDWAEHVLGTKTLDVGLATIVGPKLLDPKYIPPQSKEVLNYELDGAFLTIRSNDIVDISEIFQRNERPYLTASYASAAGSVAQEDSDWALKNAIILQGTGEFHGGYENTAGRIYTLESACPDTPADDSTIPSSLALVQYDYAYQNGSYHRSKEFNIALDSELHTTNNFNYTKPIQLRPYGNKIIEDYYGPRSSSYTIEPIVVDNNLVPPYAEATIFFVNTSETDPSAATFTVSNNPIIFLDNGSRTTSITIPTSTVTEVTIQYLRCYDTSESYIGRFQHHPLPLAQTLI